jgi:hypothetical protein
VRTSRDRQLSSAQRDGDLGAPDLHRKLEAVELLDRCGVEVEDVVAYFRSEVCALYQVQGASHHPQVDSLLGGAALYVADVALQRGAESLPGRLRIDGSQRACVGDEAER